MKHITVGRLMIVLFSYWIGFSWRYVSPLGRTADFGYLKFVWRPSPDGDGERHE